MSSDYLPAKDQEPNRVLVGILAILLGGLGVHKFVLGFTSTGLVQLLLYFCFGIGHVIGIIEGIIYPTKTDDEFYQIYVVDKKQWF